ncbi:UV protection and mutation protein [Marinomonas rhizomae]|uniref:DNA polymerase V n=1 Tax=Marinomonas rhizomae TaxID=491948 RepID=A0A366IWI1_9GAMM|nr:S24 family peptidase [Marinomonas rhizomae]RBP79132.1 DNA polymerase V [Marinomonas rhizomae]RNF70423.1 UV protection and mutation protein [Marinomonas rhizomae]
MRVSYLGTSESAAFIAANSVRIPLYPESAILSDVSGPKGDQAIDLHTLCASNPAAIFFVRAQGEPMEREGIQAGDVLEVNRSLTARHGDTVLAFVQGKMAIVTLELNPDVLLQPKNKAYAATAMSLPEEKTSALEVFGVVTSVVR